MDQLEQLSLLRFPKPLEPSTSTSSFSGNGRDISKIKHPYYPDDFEQNVIMMLYAFDRQGGGLHYGTVLVACGLLAGNAWNGYFTLHRDRTTISCYFHVPSPSTPDSDSYDYAIFPSFEHWTFPHNGLPPNWSHSAADAHRDGEDAGLAPPSASNLTAAVIRRDGSCRVTGSRDYVEKAHLCPRSQAAWFEANTMGQYNLNQEIHGDNVVDDVCNAKALRSDLHKAFDDRKFVCVPKESRWVLHFFGPTNTLGRLYHNTVLRLDPDISPNLLLARFAWTVFPLIHKFLAGGASRKLTLRVIEEGRIKEVTKTVTAKEIAAMEPMRGRNSSPKKRRVASEMVPEVESRTIERQRLSSPPGRTALDPSQDITTLALKQNPQSTKTCTDQDLNLRDNSTATTPSSNPPSARAHVLWSPDLNPNTAVSSSDRAKWIKSRRPSNPDLYCCDYNRAESATQEGLPGKEEFGGGHLCLECLGFEYIDIDENEHCT